VDKVRVNGVGALRNDAGRSLIPPMDKPVTNAPEAAAIPEVPQAAAAPAKALPAAEVVAPAAAPVRARSEKALRLAQALRDNLRRRKAARPAKPSN
jgi:hypothetical protein